MYLSTLTDDELLRYAGTLQLSPLETELVSRFAEFKDETGDKDADIEKLGDENNTLSEKVDELEEKVDELEEKVDELTNLDEENNSLREKCEALEEEVNELTEALNESLA